MYIYHLFAHRCALVALAMAADLLQIQCPDVHQLLTIARQQDYTRYGEMFSGMLLISNV